MIISVAAVLDAANALSAEMRPALAAALRERAPEFYWTIERNGRLACNHGSWARAWPERWPPHADDYEARDPY